MYGYEPRDRSGPMDIDDNDPMRRIADFALPQPEDGPSRKRPHVDMSAEASSSSSGHRSMTFGTDTPFLFHLSRQMRDALPPQSGWKPYDPREWQAHNFGYVQGKPDLAGQGEDVDMTESPARRHDSHNEQDQHMAEEKGDKASQASDRATNQSEDKENAPPAAARPMAKGAISREVKKRVKKGKEKANQWANPREPIRTEHQHHYNFHSHAPSLRHTEIPSLLIGYVQVFVNVSVVLFIVYLAVNLVLTIRRDVKDRMQEVSIEILQEIAECNHLYLTNRCDPTLRVPAMDAPCKAWESCMSRDPMKVQRTNVLAETFAGVINSFVDPISWKTMGFTLTTLCFLIILTNSALWNLRSKVQDMGAPAPSSAYGYPPLQSGWHAPHIQGGNFPPYNSVEPMSQQPKQLGYQDKKWWKRW